MSKFFNNNNATVNQSQETEQHQSSKLGWLKTGVLIVGGIGASVGAAIGAKKLYEKFTDLDGELDVADLQEDLEDQDGSGMEFKEPTENETNDSSNQETSFKEVEPESNSDESIFVSAEELADTKDTSSVPKPELDENGNFILPKGKSWNDLVRKDIIVTFEDLESYFMNTEIGDPIWIIRSSVNIFNKAKSFADKTAWENAYVESMREDLDAYLMRYVRGLVSNFAKTHRMGDIIYMRRIFDEYLSSPFYSYPIGKDMRDELNKIESEFKKYKALKHFPAQEEDELDKELESSEDSKENLESPNTPEVRSTPDSSISTKEDVGEAETAATLAATAPAAESETKNTVEDEEKIISFSTVEPETAKEVSGETNNNNASAIEEFKEKIAEVKRRIEKNPIDARKYFNTDVKCYMFDDNIPASVKDDLKKLEADIKDKIYDHASKKLTSGNPVNKKKGGKRSYKKNGRR